MVGEDERGHFLPEAAGGLVDQLPAGAVDGLVDLDQLVPGPSWVVCGVSGIEAVVAEVAGVIRAHEVDAEKLEVGLELEDGPADAGGLVDVLDQAASVGVEVLPPALAHRVVGGDVAGVRSANSLGCLRRA